LGYCVRRVALLVVSLGLTSLCSGCLAVPVKAPRIKSPGGGTLKGKVDLQFLKEGVPRAEVEQEIGWLDTGFKSRRLFIARWLDSEWVTYWGAVGYGSIGGGAERRWGTHTLFIEFDDREQVKRFATVQERDLGKALADWTSGEPPLALYPAVEIPVGHFSLGAATHTARLSLTSDAVSYREPDNPKHDFSLPLSTIRHLKFQGRATEHDRLPSDPSAGMIKVELQLTRKTPAGKRITLVAGFPEFITLLRFAGIAQVPMK